MGVRVNPTYYEAGVPASSDARNFYHRTIRPFPHRPLARPIGTRRRSVFQSIWPPLSHSSLTTGSVYLRDNAASKLGINLSIVDPSSHPRCPSTQYFLPPTQIKPWGLPTICSQTSEYSLAHFFLSHNIINNGHLYLVRTILSFLGCYPAYY